MRQRYPKYNVLDKWDSPSWNDPTRKVVADRLENVPPRRFFTENEWELLTAICDRLMPQPDREAPIPIVPWIDSDIYEHRTSGTRYETLPPIRECWREGLARIDAEAAHRNGCGFCYLAAKEQDAVLHAVDSGEATEQIWQGFAPQRFFRHILLKTVVALYYAHPEAWNEIGFGGPASPRGYLRTGIDRRDPWEAEEVDEKEQEATS